ncbi:MAG: hypothetical protein A2987_07345 [Omnitrophica bacterium RIFCSPLOWO2_01_FULL_45_10]|nr:MAG: hypothetical protein A2987_07345 [Omnitrophica bacterium RIFCSPLOWO2_01_FULL_45_10]
MNLRKSKIFIFALTLVLLGACSKGSAIEMGQTAPDFTLNDTNGKSTSLSQFKGKVLILDFFASWCPPCKEEIPDFIELHKTYGSQGLSIVGVSLTNAQDSKDFAQKMNINYPVLIDDNKVSNAYGPIRSIPTTFVIDKESKIAKIYIGFRPKEVFEKDILELMK